MQMWGEGGTKFFYELGPDQIMAAVEQLGLSPTGRVLALNSLENRVYEIELSHPVNDGPQGHFVVAKFYRPGRWTREQILEEHEFILDLEAEEIPVCAPLKFKGRTLSELSDQKIYYALFPKKGGRLSDELSDFQIENLGRLLARVHAVGRGKEAKHRLRLGPDTFALANLDFLEKSQTLPPHLMTSYQTTVHRLVDAMRPLFEKHPMQRLHGDCHMGNLLWRDEQVVMVDFDDMVVGPVAQDLWPILPGNDEHSNQQRALLIEAYESMGPFDHSQTRLFTPLKALRSINYASWIARRFEDPIFKQTFTWFGTDAYWQEQVHYLQQLLEKCQDEAQSYY